MVSAGGSISEKWILLPQFQYFQGLFLEISLLPLFHGQVLQVYKMSFGADFANVRNYRHEIGAGLIYRQGVDTKPIGLFVCSFRKSNKFIKNKKYWIKFCFLNSNIFKVFFSKSHFFLCFCIKFRLDGSSIAQKFRDLEQALADMFCTICTDILGSKSFCCFLIGLFVCSFRKSNKFIKNRELIQNPENLLHHLLNKEH